MPARGTPALSDGLALLAGAFVRPFDLTGRREAARCWEEACIPDISGPNVERHALADFERRRPVDFYIFMIRNLQDIYASGKGSVIGPQSATKVCVTCIAALCLLNFDDSRRQRHNIILIPKRAEVRTSAQDKDREEHG